MIEVKVRADGITITGHADYAPAGQDIVCAGISTLFQTLIQSIESLTTDRITYKIISGASELKYGKLSEQAKILVDAFFVGVLLIVDIYPDYVYVN